MSPISVETPKSMMPLWGKPLLAHTLDMLERWRVREVLVNLHHAPGPVLNYLRHAGARRRLVINLSFEPEILGTGGAIRRADWFVGNAPFWIVNADVAMDLSPGPFLDAFRRFRPIAVLWLNDKRGPRTVEASGGRISNFRSARPGTSGSYTFCGVHLASPRILDFIPTGFSSVIDAYEASMKAGRIVAGVCPPDSFWADAGTPEGYLLAHRLVLEAQGKRRAGGRLLNLSGPAVVSKLRRRGVKVAGFASIGGNVTFARGARIADSVIWDNAVIGSHAVVENALVADGARVDTRVVRMVLRAEAARDGLLLDTIRRLGWKPEDTIAQPLAPRGSARTFVRIAAGDRSAMVVRYSLERPENGLYVRNARLLAKIGVRVPAILMDRPDQNLTVIEDAGDCSLLDHIRGRPARAVIRAYSQVLDSVLVLHAAGAGRVRAEQAALSEPFSGKLYCWERELFAKYFLVGCLSLKGAGIRGAMNDLELVARRLAREPAVLIHRDLQSSNILFFRDEPVFIDFQGMRLGPALYDLASLLCDPYVSLVPPIQDRLVGYYAARSGGERGRTKELFWIAAIERLIQALGAFGRLSSCRQTAHFRRYIAPGLAMIRRALEHVDNLPHLSEIVDRALELFREETDETTDYRGGASGIRMQQGA